jgi:nicotinamide riboside kinase
MSAQFIAVIGAECTGKTALCQALAQRLLGLWVPEYLREFCAAQGRTPTAIEQIHIMLTQQAREAQQLAAAQKKHKAWVLCDSAPLVTALYSQRYFNDTGLLRAALAHHRNTYAATLLCAPDIDWQPDGIQRDGQDVRAAFDEALTIALAEHGIAAHRVTGQGDSRIEAALAALPASTAPESEQR